MNASQLRTEPIWTGIQFLKPFGGSRGGWFFSIKSIQIASNTPVFFTSQNESLKVMLVNERDVGINYITNRPEHASWFVNNLTTRFNKTLATKCFS